MNLTEYLQKHHHSQDFIDLIQVIVAQVQPIKNEFLGGDQKAGTYNLYGEEQIALDKKANEILISAFRESKLIKQAGSEEEAEVLHFDSEHGHFGVTIDPLDGSSLIPTNLAVGIIVSIYENGEIMSGLKNITAAFYILLGPLTLLVFADNQSVSQFVMNEAGLFDLVKENMQLPDKNKLFSPGGLKKDWPEKHKALIQKFENDGMKLRYSGSFVPDFHQVLTYGGIFSYPALIDKPEGKLRVLFEVGPMSFIATKAGGLATDGINLIAAIVPTKVDHRTPVYVGSKSVIEEAKQLLK